MAVPKDPREIETADPFRALFPIDPTVRDLVASSIRQSGYDPNKPILAWRDAFGEHGRTVCVDGHTRRAVAIELGLDSVPVTMRRFDSVDAAIAGAIGEQAQRRNLNPSQLAIHVLTMLDRFDDGFSGQGARNDLYGRSAKQLAEMIGVTSRTIERARQLIAFGDDALLAQVKAGEIGLKTAIEHGQREDRATAAAPRPVPPPRSAEPEFEQVGDEPAEPARSEPPEPEMDEREPQPPLRPQPRNRLRRPGEMVRKGVHERARLAENALRLMWWEFESELAAQLKTADDAETRSDVIDTFEWKVDEDSTLAGLLDAMRGLVDDARGSANLLKKIEAMRNTAGRTPAEAALFEAKAAQLEAEAS